MTRQVALADDAYDQLAKIRRPNESFSDVVRRLCEEERRRILQSLAGSWKMSEDEVRVFDEIHAFRKTKARGADR